MSFRVWAGFGLILSGLARVRAYTFGFGPELVRPFTTLLQNVHIIFFTLSAGDTYLFIIE